MARLERLDWLKHGMKQLAIQGPEKLTIQALCASLGVTKGSFYHHFTNQQSYVEALLTYWEDTLTREIIETSNSKATLLERIEELTDLTTSKIAIQLEVAIRAWALVNPVVKNFQQRVDEQRLAYLIELTSQIPGGKGEAKLLAQALFAIYVGAQQIIPPIEQTELKAIYNYIKKLAVIPRLNEGS